MATIWESVEIFIAMAVVPPVSPRVIKSADVKIQQEEAAMPLWTRQRHPSRKTHQRKEVSQPLQSSRLQVPRLQTDEVDWSPRLTFSSDDVFDSQLSFRSTSFSGP